MPRREVCSVFMDFRYAFPLRVRPRRDTVSRFGIARFMLAGTYFDPAGFSTFNRGDSVFIRQERWFVLCDSFQFRFDQFILAQMGAHEALP